MVERKVISKAGFCASHTVKDDDGMVERKVIRASSRRSHKAGRRKSAPSKDQREDASIALTAVSTVSSVSMVSELKSAETRNRREAREEPMDERPLPPVDDDFSEQDDYQVSEMDTSLDSYIKSALLPSFAAASPSDRRSVMSGKSDWTTWTGVAGRSSVHTQSSRVRRPGAAKARLAKAKENVPRKNGWHDTIRVAATNSNRKWEPERGWVDFIPPKQPPHTPVTDEAETDDESEETPVLVTVLPADNVMEGNENVVPPESDESFSKLHRSEIEPTLERELPGSPSSNVARHGENANEIAENGGSPSRDEKPSPVASRTNGVDQGSLEEPSSPKSLYSSLTHVLAVIGEDDESCGLTDADLCSILTGDHSSTLSPNSNRVKEALDKPPHTRSEDSCEDSNASVMAVMAGAQVAAQKSLLTKKNGHDQTTSYKHDNSKSTPDTTLECSDDESDDDRYPLVTDDKSERTEERASEVHVVKEKIDEDDVILFAKNESPQVTGPVDLDELDDSSFSESDMTDDAAWEPDPSARMYVKPNSEENTSSERTDWKDEAIRSTPPRLDKNMKDTSPYWSQKRRSKIQTHSPRDVTSPALITITPSHSFDHPMTASRSPGTESRRSNLSPNASPNRDEESHRTPDLVAKAVASNDKEETIKPQANESQALTRSASFDDHADDFEKQLIRDLLGADSRELPRGSQLIAPKFTSNYFTKTTPVHQSVEDSSGSRSPVHRQEKDSEAPSHPVRTNHPSCSDHPSGTEEWKSFLDKKVRAESQAAAVRQNDVSYTVAETHGFIGLGQENGQSRANSRGTPSYDDMKPSIDDGSSKSSTGRRRERTFDEYMSSLRGTDPSLDEHCAQSTRGIKRVSGTGTNAEQGTLRKRLSARVAPISQALNKAGHSSVRNVSTTIKDDDALNEEIASTFKLSAKAYPTTTGSSTRAILERRTGNKHPCSGAAPGSEAKAMSESERSHNERWQAFLDRKASSRPSLVGMRANSTSDITRAAEKYAAEKVDEMMEALAKKSNSTPRGLRDEDGAVDEAFDLLSFDTPSRNGKHTSNARGNRSNASTKSTKEGKTKTAAQELAAARVEAMMAVLSSRSNSKKLPL